MGVTAKNWNWPVLINHSLSASGWDSFVACKFLLSSLLSLSPKPYDFCLKLALCFYCTHPCLGLTSLPHNLKLHFLILNSIPRRNFLHLYFSFRGGLGLLCRCPYHLNFFLLALLIEHTLVSSDLFIPNYALTCTFQPYFCSVISVHSSVQCRSNYLVNLSSTHCVGIL